jgi:glycosyltransferase involved in cell wall biosynthesis
MKVGWIAPLDRKCGIAFYSRKYADAISRHVQIVECDPDGFLSDRKGFLASIAGCDCVHIQYEPSFFLRGRRDYYHELCRQIRAKKIVSLHEVYREIPGVFPRENVRGNWPVKALRKFVWDKRHVHWAAFARHLRASFHADALVVHSHVQEDILIEKGIDKEKITVIPLPIKVRPETKTAHAKRTDADADATISLGASGFINPLYDYDMLVHVLDNMKEAWRFTWVGGLRRDEDAGILRRLESEIDKRGWSRKFTITGWVSDEERDRLVDGMDAFCAFFKERSSSESLADAIAARKPVIASRIPLTEDLAAYGPLLLLAPPGPEETAQCIRALLADRDRLRLMEQAAAAYGRKYSYEECGTTMNGLYERVMTQ